MTDGCTLTLEDEDELHFSNSATYRTVTATHARALRSSRVQFAGSRCYRTFWSRSFNWLTVLHFCQLRL